MICTYCSATMPEVSAFCPGCGRAVESEAESSASVPDVAPLSRDALVAAIAYVTFVPAVVVLLIPALRNVRFVRFHSLQSLLFALATLVIGGATRLMFAILPVLPFVGFLLAWLVVGLVALAMVFLWIVIMVKAALGDAYELPVIGRFAADVANRE
jgi:uncharacterized membrane protein